MQRNRKRKKRKETEQYTICQTQKWDNYRLNLGEIAAISPTLPLPFLQLFLASSAAAPGFLWSQVAEKSTKKNLKNIIHFFLKKRRHKKDAMKQLHLVHCPKRNRLSAIWHEMKRGKRDTTRNISCCIVSCFPLHFILYRVNLDCFSNSVERVFIKRVRRY